MSESFKSVCRSCYMVRDIPGDPFLGEQVCTPCLERYAPKVTIPRDQYELYKEAAEAWAADRTALDNGWSYNHEHCCWTCMECYVALQPFDRSPVLHAADCKAARILNLKREP